MRSRVASLLSHSNRKRGKASRSLARNTVTCVSAKTTSSSDPGQKPTRPNVPVPVLLMQTSPGCRIDCSLTLFSEEWGRRKCRSMPSSRIQRWPNAHIPVMLSAYLGASPRDMCAQISFKVANFHPLGSSRDIAKLPQKAHHPRFRCIPLGLQLDQLFHFRRDIDLFGFFAQMQIAADIEVEIIRLDFAHRH